MGEDIDRVSVTVPPALLDAVDDVVEAGEYDSRSEATRDALRAFVTKYNRESDLEAKVSGTVVVLYDHHAAGSTDELTAIQHEFEDTIVAVHHVHLDDHLCLESIAVDGAGEDVEAFVSRLRPLESVHQVEVTVLEVDT